MFRRFRNRGSGESDAQAADLVGCWQLIETGAPGEEPAEAEFRDDGTLIYSVDAGDRWQIMRLTYQVDGHTLVTNQPSAAKVERTRWSISPDGVLQLEFGGDQTHYTKGPKRAPSA